MGFYTNYTPEEGRPYIDWVSVTLLVILAAFGLFLLLTINRATFYQQLVFFGLSAGTLIIFSRIDPVFLWWFAPYGYALAIIAIAATYLFPAVRGSTRWIFLFGAQLQPSELVKPFLLLAFARFMSVLPPKSGRNILFHSLFFIVPFFLVFRQPDLGTSIVYFTMWLAMMIAGGLPLWALGLGVLGLGVVTPWVWIHLADYQKARISTFFSPGFDPQGAGYNALQSMIAVGSGSFLGRGLGRGTQSHLRFLPEHHTDFIFATLVEELGFVGGLLLLLIYASLLWRVLAPLWRRVVTDIFPFTFSVGLFTMILMQVVIHAGMNMGILPITGITLPFVSYGGSSVLSLTVSFALLWSVRRFTGVASRSPNW